MKTYARKLLLGFLFFHLLVILVIPNGRSHLGRMLEAWIVPYSSVLGMNTSWNFFSPDPAHTMYIKYTYFFRDDHMVDLKEPEVHYFPGTKDQGEPALKDRRTLYAMRYMILDQNRLPLLLAPWLCRLENAATQVKIEHIIDPIPAIDLASFEKDSNIKSLVPSIQTINREFQCQGGQDEISL